MFEVDSASCHASEMGLLTNIVSNFLSLTTFAESSILDVRNGSKCAFSLGSFITIYHLFLYLNHYLVTCDC